MAIDMNPNTNPTLARLLDSTEGYPIELLAEVAEALDELQLSPYDDADEYKHLSESLLSKMDARIEGGIAWQPGCKPAVSR